MSTPARYVPGQEVLSGSLYRRIPPNDPARWSEGRPTRYNFLPAKVHQHLSMHLAEFVTPEQIFRQFPGFGLFEIEVGALLAEGLTVKYMPEAAPDHAGVFGLKNAKNAILDGLRKQIVRAWEPGSQRLVYTRSPS